MESWSTSPTTGLQFVAISQPAPLVFTPRRQSRKLNSQLGYLGEPPEVLVHPDRLAAARDLTPIAERPGVGHSVLIFEGEDRQRFTGLGDDRTPSLSDLFLAVVK